MASGDPNSETPLQERRKNIYYRSIFDKVSWLWTLAQLVCGHLFLFRAIVFKVQSNHKTRAPECMAVIAFGFFLLVGITLEN